MKFMIWEETCPCPSPRCPGTYMVSRVMEDATHVFQSKNQLKELEHLELSGQAKVKYYRA